MRCCHQQPADHLDGCRSANFGHSLWGVAGLERPRRLIKDRATTPERGRVALPGVTYCPDRSKDAIPESVLAHLDP